jgi:hypothetical protein
MTKKAGDPCPRCQKPLQAVSAAHAHLKQGGLIAYCFACNAAWSLSPEQVAA